MSRTLNICDKLKKSMENMDKNVTQASNDTID